MASDRAELMRKMGEALGLIGKVVVELADSIAKEPHEADATGGKKRKRSEKDPDAPKRPRNAYLLYVSERMGARATDPALKDLKQKEVMTALAGEWKALSEDAKKPYLEQAKALLETYTGDKAKYVQDHKAGAAAGGAGASAAAAASSGSSAAKKARTSSEAGSETSDDEDLSDTDEASSSEEEAPAPKPKPSSKAAPAPAPAPKPAKAAAPAPAPAPKAAAPAPAPVSKPSEPSKEKGDKEGSKKAKKEHKKSKHADDE